MANIWDLLYELFGPKEPAEAPVAPIASIDHNPAHRDDNGRIVPVDPVQTDSSPEPFLASLYHLSVSERDAAIKDKIIAGYMPSFLEKTVAVHTSAVFSGTSKTLVFHVFPDYLCVGSDSSFLSVPMAYNHASEIAAKLGCSLPTRHMVNLIYQAAAVRLTPHPMPPGPDMQSTDYVVRQNTIIEAEKHALGAVNGILLAGHKKDVVISPQYASNPGKEAIYGWHTASGIPIQPLSFAHDQQYSDYSHGARMVSCIMQLDGVDMHINQILKDPQLHVLLSDEGHF